MNILLDIINNPEEAHWSGKDHRFAVLTGVMRELMNRGHNVWATGVTPVAREQIKIERLPEPPSKYNQRLKGIHLGRKVGLFITFSPYHPKRAEAFKSFKKSGDVLCYEHSWLKSSVLIDPKGVFSDSAYYETLNDMVQENFDYDAAEAFRQELLAANSSKRPQAGKGSVPDEEFIFFPGQTLFDASIVNFSREGLFSMLDKTIRFARNHGLHVVFKPHPGSRSRIKKHGKEEIEQYCKKQKKAYKGFFHVVDAPIYELMQKSKYTVCVNCGSVMDNCVTQTPVLCGGEMYLTNTDAILYAPNAEQGLEKIHNQDYDVELMKLRQLQLLWWAKNSLLLASNTAKENTDRLSKHLGYSL